MGRSRQAAQRLSVPLAFTRTLPSWAFTIYFTSPVATTIRIPTPVSVPVSVRVAIRWDERCELKYVTGIFSARPWRVYIPTVTQYRLDVIEFVSEPA